MRAAVEGSTPGGKWEGREGRGGLSSDFTDKAGGKDSMPDDEAGRLFFESVLLREFHIVAGDGGGCGVC